MIVLDTDVISELVRKAPDLGVVGWLDSVDASDVMLTVVTAAELLMASPDCRTADAGWIYMRKSTDC